MSHKLGEAEYLRQWRARNPGKASKYSRRWQEKNQEKFMAYQKQYKAEHPEKVKDWRAVYYKKHGITIRDKYRRLRFEAIAIYGGKCQCCGEANPYFLTFDHIDGRGAEHRKTIYGGHGSGGTTIVKWLKANDWPRDNFQLLCFNCNCAKGFYGTCPHESMTNLYDVSKAGA